MPRRTEVSLRPQVSPQNPEVIRHPGLAPVAEGNNSGYPRQEQQLFALNVWSWGRGGARGKAGH